MATETLVP